MTANVGSFEEERWQREFAAIRARYKAILQEVLDSSAELPDWVINPASACACGDKCSTGTTDLDRFSAKALPPEAQIAIRQAKSG
jgi:hypothetical protein